MQPRSHTILARLAVLTAAMLLAACTRSASTAPTSGAGGATSSPLTGQQATMEAVRSALLTQTAQAVQGGAGASATPAAAGVITATGAAGTPAGIAVTPAATNTPLPIPTLTVPDNYTLQEGEFPYCLARRFNRNPDDLLAINGLSNNSLVVPGQSLRIPSSGTFPGPRALLSHPTSYVVVGGDTIYSVACRFGDVDPLAIAAVNGLSSPYTLTPGRTIQIP